MYLFVIFGSPHFASKFPIATFYVKITQPFQTPESITNPVKFLKIHNFFILDPILDPKTDLECSTKIDFSYDTFSLIEKVSKQR